MKATIYTEYGPPEVLHSAEVEKPTPKENEILVRVYATTVNYGDTLARNFKNVPLSEFNMPSPLWLPVRLAFGFTKPKKLILGSEFAGEVEAVGKQVKRFTKGDQVFGYLGQTMGAYAEYLCIPEDKAVAKKPTNMSYAEAAAIPYGVIMAMGLLKKVDIQPGQKVLVIGASGAIGSAAVQLAKYYGADVTGVCGTPRLEMVRALGADEVIDYTKEDFTQNGQTYDLIFDILGKGSFSRIKGSLNENGVYLLASFKMKKLFQMAWTAMFSSKKVICALANENPENLTLTKTLVEEGAINTVIDRCYPLAQAAAAHKYYESGQKQGNVVIVVAEEN